MTDIPNNELPDNYRVDWEKLEAEARKSPEWQRRYGRPPNLPGGWEEMSIDELWARLNDPARRTGVPKPTYDAVRYVLYTHGTSYRRPKWLMDRLIGFSKGQLGELVAWIDARNASFERDGTVYRVNDDVRALVAAFERAAP